MVEQIKIRLSEGEKATVASISRTKMANLQAEGYEPFDFITGCFGSDISFSKGMIEITGASVLEEKKLRRLLKKNMEK